MVRRRRSRRRRMRREGGREGRNFEEGEKRYP